MESNRKHKVRIIKEYLSNRFSLSTEEKVQQWIIATEDDKDIEEASLEYFNAIRTSSDASTYKLLSRVNQKTGNTSHWRKLSLYRTFSRIAAVFLLLFAVSGGIYYYYSRADMVEILAACGEEKHLFLPDGTEVWINSGTSLRYARTGSSKERKVILNGEAYFSVKRDESIPFIVQTEKLSVKVLGTRFNVKAYKGDERTVTTLESGKVEVKTKNKKSFILDSNQQLSYNHKTLDVRIVEVPAEDIDGWRNGQLIFSNASVFEIVQTIEREFNLTVNADSRLLSDEELYTVKFIKNDSLSDVLNVLSNVIGFSYTQEGNIIQMQVRK